MLLVAVLVQVVAGATAIEKLMTQGLPVAAVVTVCVLLAESLAVIAAAVVVKEDPTLASAPKAAAPEDGLATTRLALALLVVCAAQTLSIVVESVPSPVAVAISRCGLPQQGQQAKCPTLLKAHVRVQPPERMRASTSRKVEAALSFRQCQAPMLQTVAPWQPPRQAGAWRLNKAAAAAAVAKSHQVVLALKAMFLDSLV